MQKFQTLADAVALAEFAHRNQKDKAGFDYVEHPKRVLASVQAMGAPPFVQIAAVLHDIAEDTPFSVDILKSLGFSEAVLVLVDLVTYFKGETRDDYYARIARNEWATKIKLADINDNTLPWRMAYLDQATQKRLNEKYNKAKLALGVNPVRGL